jgi:hypothetical protein
VPAQNVRNPWGSDEPDFAWNDKDRKHWTPEMQKRVGYNPVASGDDGIFWVCFSDFIKFFEGINTVEKFEALGLPIKNVTKCSDGTANVAYEIDVSQSRKLNAAL